MTYRKITKSMHVFGKMIDLCKPLIRRGIERRLTQEKELASRINQRFGRASIKKRPKGNLLWLHGASLGETNSILPLVDAFLDADDQNHVLVTSGSKSSTQQLMHSLPKRAFHQLLPAENGIWIKRFLAHWQPDALVLAEQEFWPRLLMEVSCNDIPSLVINARLSVKSARRWKWLAALGLNFPSLVTEFHCQSDQQAQRFQALNVGPISVTGNLKFAREIAPRQPSSPIVAQKDQQEGGRQWVIAIAMTHPDEEDEIKSAVQDMLRSDSSVRVLWGPRHVERTAELQKILADYNPSLWSTGDRGAKLCIVDQYGVMDHIYAEANVCILGGTFSARIGGHSPIEALCQSVPVIVGPEIWAQESIMEPLIATGAIESVPTAWLAVSKALALRDQPASITRQLQAFCAQREQGKQALAAAVAWSLKTVAS